VRRALGWVQQRRVLLTPRHARRGIIAVLSATALAASACGGSGGEAVQNEAEERARGALDKATDAPRREGRDRALREIDRLEREAKRELQKNGARRIEEAADRARAEVRRRTQ
jgi:hypothetical protein